MIPNFILKYKKTEERQYEDSENSSSNLNTVQKKV